MKTSLDGQYNYTYDVLDYADIVTGSFLPVYAKKAQYDANDGRHGCLEDTRVGMLERIHQWIAQPTGDVLWINGPAGTGKTTVAYSVAYSSKKREILAASFFCSRSDAECSDANLVIVTIVRQMCRYHAPYKEEVEDVLQKDPDVVHSNLARQFEELIVQPLEALKDPFPRAVVVLDGLDECIDKGAVSTFLTVLARFISRVKEFLLFLVTSRPEPHIIAMFTKAREDSMAGATTLFLHEEEPKSVLEDIRHYLDYEFEAQAGTYKVQNGWPSPQDIDTLAEMSHGLFIWAVIAVRLIMQGDPPEEMRQLTAKRADAMPRETVLDSLYTQIAESVASKIPTASQEWFQKILGTIAIAREPLSAAAIAEILGFPSSDTVYNLLRSVRSVLHVPEAPEEPIRAIHPTFSEYLLSSNLKKPDTFRIDASMQHCTLFSRSLATMDHLECDIAGIGDPLLFKSDITALDEVLQQCIPSHLRYVCRYWSTHFGGAVDSGRLPRLHDRFMKFLRKQFLNWLEVCSLLRMLDHAAIALEAARRVCQVRSGSASNTIPISHY